MTKLKITAVSYLNTKPLLYGILKSPVAQQIDLQLDIPSVCADRLASGDADLGLVPVAVLPHLTTPHLISEYCIGAVGAVKTVAIFGECPLEKMERIYLDFHSRTSVLLTRHLIQNYWQLTPELIPAEPGYEHQIRGATGGLVIGDRAIDLEQKFPFMYDLGEAWHQHTGLPFVFAAWVSTRPLDPVFIQRFNQAMAQGIREIPQLIYLLPAPVNGFDLTSYFTQNISYELDAEKRKGLRLFLSTINESIPQTLEKSLLKMQAAN